MEDCLKKTVKQLKEELLRLNVHAPSRFKTKKEMCEQLLLLSNNITNNVRKINISVPENKENNIIAKKELYQLDALPVEIREKILLTLPYQDIINYCKTSKIGAEICRDNNFWKDKADVDGVPKNLLESQNLNYSQRYGQLINIYGDCLLGQKDSNCLSKAVINGDIPVLEFLINKDPNQSELASALTKSVDMDKYDIANILAKSIKGNELSQHDQHFIYYSLKKIAYKGYVELLIYIIKNIVMNFIDQVFSNSIYHESLSMISKSNDPKKIQLMINTFNYNLNDYDDAIIASISTEGDQDFIYDADNADDGDDIYQDNVKNKVVHMNSLAYLLDNYPGNLNLNFNAVDNFLVQYDYDLNLDTLKLLVEHGYSNYDIVLLNAVENNNTDVVRWILLNGHVSREAFNHAVYRAKINYSPSILERYGLYEIRSINPIIKTLLSRASTNYNQ